MAERQARQQQPSRNGGNQKPAPQKKRVSIFGILTALILIVIVFILSMTGVAVYVISNSAKQLPNITDLMIPAPNETSKIYASTGEAIADIYVENREFANYQEIPPIIQLAFIAIEDERFYKHHGVDVEGLIRISFLYAKTKGGKKHGASTITQQLIRGAFNMRERTLSRKLKEIILAIALEKKYSKDEILTAYLNYNYFGHGAYGVKTASREFFGKRLKDVDLEEAALLAALVKSPTNYSPYTHSERALERRNVVLAKMRDLNFITQNEFVTAAGKPIAVEKLSGPGYESYKAPHFVTYVLDIIQDPEFPYPLKLKDIYTQGYKIYTTLDKKLNRYAAEAVDFGLKMARDRGSNGCNITQGAIVAMDPRTGDILAMIGGADYKKSKFNRAWQALRQPGSAFKPFTYLAALENGFTMESSVLDAPVCYHVDRQKPYCPDNYDHRYKGMISLRTALIQSRNVPAVKIAKTVGLDKVIETARKLGITTPLAEYPSMPLGAYEINLLELTTGYAAIANGGYRVYPNSIIKIEDSNGIVVYERKPKQGDKVLDDNTIARIIPVMEDVIKYGTGTKARIGRPAGGKTGTTSDYRDAWFMGFTPEIVTGVWFGNDDNSALRDRNSRKQPTGAGITGGMIPAPAWAFFMNKALEGKAVKAFALPPKKDMSSKYVRGGNGISYASQSTRLKDTSKEEPDSEAPKKTKRYNLLEPDILDFSNSPQENPSRETNDPYNKNFKSDNSEELF